MSNADMQKDNMKSERYILWRDGLLKAGFKETRHRTGIFFLPATTLTAFVITLEDDEDGLFVVYGFTSTAHMVDYEDRLAQIGVDSSSCQIRNILFVHEENEKYAVEAITEYYDLYKDCSKEEILALKKKRQKVFLDHFTTAMKPLGFRKKGAKWTRDLHDGTALTLEAQKSAFSDQYYFNVVVHDVKKPNVRQSFTRVVMYNNDIYDWQLMNERQIENLILYTLDNYISPFFTKK